MDEFIAIVREGLALVDSGDLPPELFVVGVALALIPAADEAEAGIEADYVI